MPGTYAHITMVNLFREPARLEAIDGFDVEAITCVLDHFKYCELGAVSPDYPYLCVGHEQSNRWADLMHAAGSGALLRSGVDAVCALGGENRRKGLAWLLGFASHVAMDVTIHPVVEMKVGPYADNKRAHRECEMHQDTYIYRRLKLGPVGLSEHLDSGIGACCEGADRDRLDAAIVALWRSMLRAAYPDEYVANAPDNDRWHRWFRAVVDRIMEEGNRLLPLSRHVAVDCGLAYPRPEDVDPQFVRNLGTPAGAMDYDAIFDRAEASVAQLWSLVGRAAAAADAGILAPVGDWNLDTGRDEAGRLVFWS